MLLWHEKDWFLKKIAPISKLHQMLLLCKINSQLDKRFGPTKIQSKKEFEMDSSVTESGLFEVFSRNRSTFSFDKLAVSKSGSALRGFTGFTRLEEGSAPFEKGLDCIFRSDFVDQILLCPKSIQQKKCEKTKANC